MAVTTDARARLTESLADRYAVRRELGAGVMASVYHALDLKHQRDVAIEVLHPDLGAALGAERFLSEIRTTARLQHPHILPLLDSGEAGGLLYYVMPLVTGETLRSRLEREQQLPIDDAVVIAGDISQPGWSADGRSALISVAPHGVASARILRVAMEAVHRSIRSCRARSIGLPARSTGASRSSRCRRRVPRIGISGRTGSEALRQHRRRSVRGAHVTPRLRGSGALTRRQVDRVREIRQRAIGDVHRALPARWEAHAGVE